ncbi:hypothetical protein Bca4012_058603 [Brassica carinata]
MIHEDVSYNDLIGVVLEDFGIDDNKNSVNLSYVSPSKLNFGTKELPPVFIRNDRQVTSYMNKLQENADIHLCVTIKRKAQISPLIISNMMQTRDEISSTHDSPIAGSSNAFERGTHTHPETEWNNIHRVDEVSGIEHTRIRDTPISPSIGVIGNKRGLHSMGPDVYESEKSKLSSFSSKRGRESMREDSHSHSEILSPICFANQRDDDNDLFCGQFFKDKKEMSTKLKLHAVTQGFEFSTQYSDKQRYILKCVDEKCSWDFRAKSVKESESFVVRHYVSKHTCDTSLRRVNHRQATAKMLGSMVTNSYKGEKIGLKPKQIIDKARDDHGVVISYSKAWRCQEHAQDLARGTPDDSFQALPSWFHMFKEKNPGFKLMRKVLSIDGVHLKSKYKGTLLAATAQDGNFHLYPIAFSIVDSENEASWSWFMMCMKTIIPDEEDLVFISDRAASIEKALLQHYPLAHHGICIFHFEKNVLDKFKSSTLIPLIVEAAYAYTKGDFDYLFDEIEASDTEVAEYLRNADFKKMIMTRWFTERRDEGDRHIHLSTFKVGEKMKELYNLKSRWLEVSKINDSEYEVKGDTRDQVVNFQNRHCSCLVFDVEKFPCAHAIAAAKAGNKHENDYVDDFFSNERFKQAYSESIYPVGDKAYWDIPSYVAKFVCRPPSTRFPSGRRKKKRIPSSREYGKYRSKSESTSKSYKCSRCGQQGHNKSTCVEPIG